MSADETSPVKTVKSVVFFKDEIFDPRQPNRQVYVRSVIGEDGIVLTRDSGGVYITLGEGDTFQDIYVPYSNIRQCLNVKERGKR